jgi:hypothetical protein
MATRRTRRRSSSRRSSTSRARRSVRSEMGHKRTGKHKIKSRKQATAIGVNKARRKGAKVPRKRTAK